jgi:hypothetical protein
MSTVMKKREESISNVFAIVDVTIDKFIRERKKPKFSLYSYLRSEMVDKKAAAEVMNNSYLHTLHEEAVGAYNKDPYLKEAYGHFSRPELRDYMNMIAEMIEDVNKYLQEKSTRIRRIRKVDPKKAVAKLSYNKESFDFGGSQVESIDPVNIFGKSCVVLYNTDNRQLTVHFGRNIQVRGSSLLNVDLEQSWTKTLRKPEEVVPYLRNSTVANIKKIQDSIKTKSKQPSNRVNKNQIIIGAY